MALDIGNFVVAVVSKTACVENTHKSYGMGYYLLCVYQMVSPLPYLLTWVRASVYSQVPQSFFLLSIVLPAILADGHEHHEHEPISLLDTKISFLADRRPERLVGGRRRQLRKKGLAGGASQARAGRLATGASQQPRRGRLEYTLTPPVQVEFSPVTVGGDHSISGPCRFPACGERLPCPSRCGYFSSFVC